MTQRLRTVWMKIGRKAAIVITLVVAAVGLTPAAAFASVNFVDCSDPNSARVNVPYYPYNYCFTGSGDRTVNITQVWSVESRFTPITMGYYLNGSYNQISLVWQQLWVPGNATIVFIRL